MYCRGCKHVCILKLSRLRFLHISTFNLKRCMFNDKIKKSVNNIWMENLSISNLCVHACGPESVRPSVFHHIQVESYLCRCAYLLWLLTLFFVTAFAWLCCSASLTYHYSPKYSTGGIPELPARNVAAAFVWNAENSSRSRRWNLDEWALLSMSQGERGPDLWLLGYCFVYLQQQCLPAVTQNNPDWFPWMSTQERWI